MTEQPQKEFRLKSGQTISGYMRRFSSTERVVFGAFVIAAVVTALVMAEQVNARFMKEVPARGGTLREGLVGLPHAVNPVIAVTDVDKDISALVYAGLTKYSDGSVVPDLAYKWSVSPDGLTYTFDLKPGLTFQDGYPLTADDVLFTVNEIQNPALKSPLAADWANVAATATSPTEIRFVLKQPYSSFPANTAVGIIPKHIWGNVSDDQFIFSQYNIQPVGAGPYKVTGIDRDQGGIPTDYKLSAWGGYSGVKPYISNIDFNFYPDQSRALDALVNGSIDSLPSISSDYASKLAADKGEPFTIATAPMSRIFGVFLNQNNNALLADQTVRQALDMSVDRQAIVDAALGGYGLPLYGPLPPGIATSSESGRDADIAGAQALLEKKGWVMGNDGIMVKAKKLSGGKISSTTLSFDLYTADAPDLKAAASILHDQWAKMGADVTIKVFEPSDLYQTVIRTRNYDALLFGQAVGSDGDMFAFWHSSERNAPGLNVAMYASSKVDKLLQDIRSNGDPTARAADYAALDQDIRSDVPAIFLYAPDFIYAMPKDLKGAELGTMTVPSDRWSSVSSWYIATDKVWDFFR
ncbi:MAG: hypothetical protein KGI49_01785 [Patescibacteria group bacterium]|nr:hypothetical protein [Patescibacteria group bacterium]